MNKLLSSILLAGLLAVPGLADARPATGETFTASIRHDDLNLASAGGRATFRGRVKAAANRECGIVPVLPFQDVEAIAQCRSQIERAAEAQVRLALAPKAVKVAGTG